MEKKNEEDTVPQKNAMALEVYLLHQLQILAKKKGGDKKVLKIYNNLGKKAKKGGDLDNKEMRKLLTIMKVPKNLLKEAGSKNGKVKDIDDATLGALKTMMLKGGSKPEEKGTDLSYDKFQKWSNMNVANATAFRKKTSAVSAFGKSASFMKKTAKSSDATSGDTKVDGTKSSGKQNVQSQVTDTKSPTIVEESKQENNALKLESFILKELNKAMKVKDGEKKLKSMYFKLGKKVKKNDDIGSEEVRKLISVLKVPNTILTKIGVATAAEIDSITLHHLRHLILKGGTDNKAVQSSNISWVIFLAWVISKTLKKTERKKQKQSVAKKPTKPTKDTSAAATTNSETGENNENIVKLQLNHDLPRVRMFMFVFHFYM